MSAYLLGTQALVDAARNQQTAIHKWADTEQLSEDEVVASVASFSLFKRNVDALDLKERTPWQRLFNAALARFRSCDCILPISIETALRASELHFLTLEINVNSSRESLGELGMLVAATALEEHLTLVDRRQPYHRTLESTHGLAFYDPYV